MSVQRFISELIRAANEVGSLTPIEKTRLFQRSATIVRDFDGPAAAAHGLSECGRVSDHMTDSEISAGLLEAVSIIKDLAHERRTATG